MAIEFEGDSNRFSNIQYMNHRPSFSIRMIYKLRLAKTEEVANKILLVISITLFVVAGAVLFWNIHKTNTPPKIKYNFSGALLKKLPPQIQAQILD